MRRIRGGTGDDMWAIPQVTSKAPINRRRHTCAEPATRERGCCFCHDCLLSQIASWYAPKQNAVASRTDLGLALALQEHSRSTYHNSVRHSFVHWERRQPGTSKEEPHHNPR